MFLSPSATITPLGFKLHGSGIDDRIWFKFKTDSRSLSDVFDTEVVDISAFRSNYSFHIRDNNPEWWDISEFRLTGAEVSLPNVKFMHVGARRVEDGFVLYILWHET